MRKITTKKNVLAGHLFLVPVLNNVPVPRVIETQPPWVFSCHFWQLCDIVVAAFAFIFGDHVIKLPRLDSHNIANSDNPVFTS